MRLHSIQARLGSCLESSTQSDPVISTSMLFVAGAATVGLRLPEDGNQRLNWEIGRGPRLPSMPDLDSAQIGLQTISLQLAGHRSDLFALESDM